MRSTSVVDAWSWLALTEPLAFLLGVGVGWAATSRWRIVRRNHS
jgi:hypothetical protein